MAALFGGLKAGSGVASTKLFEYSKVATKKLEEVKNAVIENVRLVRFFVFQLINPQTMLGDLNKEQDEFEKQLQEEREKLKNIDLPWQGLPDETLAKKQMLSLSTDTRNFLRDSAANSEYTYEQQQAMATLLLKIDPNLANVRFQLVPKQWVLVLLKYLLTEQVFRVKENQFWQNYFYRIGLIRQSMQGQGSTGRTTPTQVATSSVVEKEVEEPEVTSQVPEVSEKPAPVLESVNVEKEKEPEPERVGEESQEESGEDEEEKEPVLTTEQPAAPGEATLTSVGELDKLSVAEKKEANWKCVNCRRRVGTWDPRRPERLRWRRRKNGRKGRWRLGSRDSRAPQRRITNSNSFLCSFTCKIV